MHFIFVYIEIRKHGKIVSVSYLRVLEGITSYLIINYTRTFYIRKLNTFKWNTLLSVKLYILCGDFNGRTLTIYHKLR